MSVPAFPLQYVHADEDAQYNGMTLRDYFAAKAMQGLIPPHGYNYSPEAKAVAAYELADAMLKARE